MLASKNNYSIVDSLDENLFDQLHALYRQMWWSKDRTKEEVTGLLKNCVIVAVVETTTNRLVGFARILTDEFRYAFIFDVMTPEDLRGQGIGKLVMNAALNHPKLANVKYFELTCAPEMKGYYEQFGFSEDYGNVIALRYASKKK